MYKLLYKAKIKIYMQEQTVNNEAQRWNLEEQTDLDNSQFVKHLSGGTKDYKCWAILILIIFGPTDRHKENQWAVPN